MGLQYPQTCKAILDVLITDPEKFHSVVHLKKLSQYGSIINKEFRYWTRERRGREYYCKVLPSGIEFHKNFKQPEHIGTQVCAWIKENPGHTTAEIQEHFGKDEDGIKTLVYQHKWRGHLRANDTLPRRWYSAS